MSEGSALQSSALEAWKGRRKNRNPVEVALRKVKGPDRSPYIFKSMPSRKGVRETIRRKKGKESESP